jgi:3-deoxy-manno-octulosonate cytidylyltransferase (CMP-KDO synthetase)
MENRFIGIIPARYASTRFPGKPLANLGGKPVIQRVYERVKEALDIVFVATDDRRIETAVKRFGGNAVMTSGKHKSGTDRCCEAFQKTGCRADIIINVQGDEPFIRPEQIEILKGCFNDSRVQIATLATPCPPDAKAFAALSDANTPKVVLDKNSEALYFSRSVIPFPMRKSRSEQTALPVYYKHIGLYAYRSDVLREITLLPQSPLEIAENLEQLRWLENGYKIKVGITGQENIGIDTPADLDRALQFLNTTG